MARPTKLTPEIKQQIGESVALGLTYALAAALAGITYQTFNFWMQKGKTLNLESTLSSISISKNATQMQQRSISNALKRLLKLEIAKFACGFWREDSQKATEGVSIGKLMQCQRIKMKMSR
jgi:hypothetical protein